MEISQTQVDRLKQELEFFFPESFKMIFHPMFVNLQGKDVDPVHTGVAVAAENDLFPYILQSYLTLRKTQLKNDRDQHIAMAGSVLMHAAGVCLLLFFKELKDMGVDKEEAGYRAPVLMAATLNALLMYIQKEYDPAKPDRTQ